MADLLLTSYPEGRARGLCKLILSHLWHKLDNGKGKRIHGICPNYQMSEVPEVNKEDCGCSDSFGH